MWGCGETMGCLALWVCTMVCTGKNIANCPELPQFLPVKCALCVLCCAQTLPIGSGGVFTAPSWGGKAIDACAVRPGRPVLQGVHRALCALCEKSAVFNHR